MEKNRLLIFATHNENKAEEIRVILPDNYEIKTLKDLDYSEDIPETQSTLEGNALQKARYVYQQYDVDCFADDTGLEIAALDGAPGVHSARYAGTERDSEKNIDLVLEKLQNKDDRTGQFRTVIALIIDGKEYLFEGVVKGKISTERHGDFGFGYDSIFYPENEAKTFGEMTLEEKNKFSHRSRAIKKMIDFLQIS
ncbi:MAG: RdgB/HAM1 family non-canonical purine NTP pyrophosphatase [Brumimicrobium sp.]